MEGEHHKKILELNTKKDLLLKYKDYSDSVKGKDLKDARRIIRSYGIILDVSKDLQKLICSLSNRIITYFDKIRKHKKKKTF